MKFKLILILQAFAIFSGAAMAATVLQLDFSADAGTQSGWEGLGGTADGTSKSGAFSGYTDLSAGDVTVSLTGLEFNRGYDNGTGAVTDFPEPDLDAMYADMLFRNDNASTVNITISGLKAGKFQITTHHLIRTPGPGTFILDVQDADSPSFGQSVGTFTQGTGVNGVSFNPNVITFDVVSNGTDNIVVRMTQETPTSGGNTGGWFGFNGMEIAPAPAAPPFDLVITPNATPGQYDFQWDSQAGKVYDLVSSTDLSTAPETWSVWNGQADLAASPPTNTLGNIAGGGDVRRFFAVLEKDAPPLLSEDFESGLPGTWATSDNGAGTAWQAGTPDGNGIFPDTEPTAAANGTQCAGTNITAPYTASATASLVSPAFTVPAGGATLNFNLYIDTEISPSGDVGSIRLLNASDDSVLVGGGVTTTNLEGVTEEWAAQSLPLPEAASGLEVKIEFLFSSDADTDLFAGFYIDDVLVEAN